MRGRTSSLQHWEDWLEVNCWAYLEMSAADFVQALAQGEVVNIRALARLLPIRDQVLALRQVELAP